MEKAQSKPARRSSTVSGVGHDRRHPPPQVPDVAGPQMGADPTGGGGVLHPAQTVVEGLEANPRLGQLAFGPLVAIGAAPQRVGRVGAQPHEGRPPFGVGEVEVPVVGDR
jgi:hypothetical protein